MTLDRDTLLLAYRTMRRIRDFEERVKQVLERLEQFQQLMLQQISLKRMLIL